jgi:hypothetical protein
VEWGKQREIFGKFFCFYRVEWGEICCLGGMEGNLLFLIGLLSCVTKFILYLNR